MKKMMTDMMKHSCRRFCTCAVLLIAVFAAMALTACGSMPSGERKKAQAAREQGQAGGMPPVETTVQETDEYGKPYREGDKDAPDLEQLVIYVPADGKIGTVMESAETLTGEVLVEFLRAYGTVSGDTKFEALDTKEAADAEAGPGGSKPQTGTLRLSGFAPGEGVSEADAKQAVIDTFRDNFALTDVTLETA